MLACAPATGERGGDIARHAARRLLGEIRDQPHAATPNDGFNPQLVVRGSTAPPSRPRT